MTTNATLNPKTITDSGLPATLETIGNLDPAHDLETLYDIAYCVGMKLRLWMYSIAQVEEKIFNKALDAGFDNSGLRDHIRIAVTEGYGNK